MPAFRVRSLRTKLLLFLLPPFVLGILILTFVALSRATNETKETAYDELAQLAQRHANEFDADVRDAMALGRSLATLAQDAD